MLFWHVFMVSLIILNIFYIPMKISFSLEYEDEFIKFPLETLPIVAFLIDIVLQFNLAYYKKGIFN
jgi:potassium voltage-gated channel Eag-related subfamily H protein 5